MAGVTYVEGVDYDLVTGTGEYSYSNFGQDGIQWIPGGSHPSIGDDLVIVYQYNSLINVLDSFFKQPAYYVMGQDRLWRWAQPTQIEVDANLKVSAGGSSQVLATVRSAVSTYINALKLGQNLEEFDIDGVVSRIYGVDNWTYNKLCVKGGTGVADLIVGPNTYARLDAGDFVINLV
jgi:hypothetical protein